MFNESFKQQVLLANRGKIVIKKPRRWLYPRNLERSYQDELVNLVARPFERLIKTIIEPRLEELHRQAQAVRPDSVEARTDTWVETVTDLVATVNFSYASIVKPDMFERAAREQALQVSLFNKDQFVKTIHSALSVNPIIEEPYLQTQIQASVRQNTSLITKLTQEQTARLEESLIRDLSSGKGLKNLRENLQANADFSKQRAALIARDQTNKFNGQLAELRQTELGIEDYIWDDVNDNRERPSHKILGNEAREGKTRKWSDSGEKPGEAIRCRCTAQPVITDALFLD